MKGRNKLYFFVYIPVVLIITAIAITAMGVDAFIPAWQQDLHYAQQTMTYEQWHEPSPGGCIVCPEDEYLEC